MDLELRDKVAVVTGASRGIGLAVVRSMLTAGARVYAGARHTSDDLVGDRLTVVEVDLAQPGGPAELAAAAGDTVNILVNNVGNAPSRPDGFLSVTDDDWLGTLNLNLMAAIRTTRAVLPLMLAAGGGSIINVCSVNSTLADPTVIDYGVAKAALANFSKALSMEFGGRGVRVNTVSPGPVATDLWLGKSGQAQTRAAATGRDPSAIADEAAKQMVTGRFTRPEEVAYVVLVLASDRTANITGSDVRIDGGLIPTW